MLVPSRVDRRTAIGRRIHATLERFGLKVGPAIRQRSAHIEAFEAGAWIGAHAAHSPAYREIRVLKDRILELLADTAPAARAENAAEPTKPESSLGDMPRPTPAPSLGRGFLSRLGGQM
jgi:chromosome partitioning protein